MGHVLQMPLFIHYRENLLLLPFRDSWRSDWVSVKSIIDTSLFKSFSLQNIHHFSGRNNNGRIGKMLLVSRHKVSFFL